MAIGWWAIQVKPDFCDCVELTMGDLTVEEYGEYVRYCVIHWRDVPGLTNREDGQ